MNHKKFVNFFNTIMIFFLLSNFLIWKLVTEKNFFNDRNYTIGDLSRISYLYKYQIIKKNEINLEKKHFEIKNYNTENKVDILTLGDSFSNGGAGGLNSYYQDFITSKTKFSVLNVKDLPDTKNYIETISIMLNSGFLNKIKVKYIILESVQRQVVKRFNQEISLDLNKSINLIENFYEFGKEDVKSEKKLQNVSFINNGNIKFFINNFMYYLSDNAYFSKVYKLKLNDYFFEHKLGNSLLFYYNDLNSIKLNTENNLTNVNNHLNELSVKLEEKGIKLIFIPAVNKYDLYSPYIINNPYSKDPFFDIFDKLEKKYLFVDTKKILMRLIEKNEKDLFYIDDTHWSYKASDIISDEIIKKLKY